MGVKGIKKEGNQWSINWECSKAYDSDEVWQYVGLECDVEKKVKVTKWTNIGYHRILILNFLISRSNAILTSGIQVPRQCRIWGYPVSFAERPLSSLHHPPLPPPWDGGEGGWKIRTFKKRKFSINSNHEYLGLEGDVSPVDVLLYFAWRLWSPLRKR